MKKKILLFISLVLLAVQGWASPVDSLNTHASTLDSLKNNRFERLDTLIPFDGFVRPGFNGDDIKNPAAIIFQILDLINKYQPFIYFDEIEDESESFVGVTIGTSVTKKYRVYGDNVSGANILNRLVEILEAFNVVAGIKFDLLEHNTEDFIDVSDEIFVEPNYLRLSDFRNGKENIITITYSPTSEKAHTFSCIGRYDLGFTSGLWNLVDYALLPVINMFGIEVASAVERTITTSEDLLDFETVVKGEAKPKTFTVKGINLAGDLTLSIDNPNYKVEPSSISAEDAANDVPVTVTYHPTEEGCHDATLLISGGKAIEVPINLKGTCVVPTITISENSLSFGPIVNGQSSSKTLTIDGSYLTSDLILYTTNSIFSVNPKRITPEEASNGATVTVSYAPTTVGTQNAILHISGGGVENGPIDVNLSGSCVTNQTITVNPPSHNYGTVNANTTNTATFTVKGTNLNDQITVVSPYEEGFTFSPETLPATGGKVTVTFEPTSEGSYSQEITLSSGDAFAKINVEGNCVIPPTIKTDVSSLNFGTVVKGKYARKTLTVTGVNLTGDLTLSSNRPYFTVSPSTITTAEAKVGKTVTVTYTPTAGGNHSATLTISGGGADSVTVSLTGKCAAIDVTPSLTHDFGTVKAGTTNTTTFTVKGTNLSDRIALAWPQENGFTITPTDLPASGGKVTVTFKPTAAGNYSQVITLSSSGVSNKITVTGKCANFTTSRTSLDFGTVVKNKEKTDTFKVKGACLTGSLTLSSSSSYFKVSPTTITAAEAAAGKTVTVTYNPTVKGTHSATITISGGSAATKLVNLTGKCVVPVITTSPSSLSYTGKESKQFTVTGTDLTGSLTLTIIGTGKSYFSLSKTSITASAAASGVTVSVLCNAPSSLQSASAQVKISGGDATTKYVDLNYNQNQPVDINSVQPGNEGDNDNEIGNNEFTNGGSMGIIENYTTDVHELSMSSKIYSEGRNIIIESPVEQSAIISDIAGRVWNVDLQAGRNVIPVNAIGVYIVRIREKTTKLMLK